MDLRNRRRLQAGLIVLVFAASLLGALVMMQTGWAPGAHSYGQEIRPERDVAGIAVTRADCKPFALADHSGAWTLVALPGPDCAVACLRQLDMLHRAQITLDKQADKLRLLYLGQAPARADSAGFGKVWTLATTQSRALDDLRATAPDSVSAVLVTPSGKAMLSYPAGFDAARVRGDLMRAVKVVL